MPTITTAEIAIVVAAVLLLYVAPFLLTTIETARRRQAQQSGSGPFAQAEVPNDKLGAGASSPVAPAPEWAPQSSAEPESVNAWGEGSQRDARPVTPPDEAVAEATAPAAALSSSPEAHVPPAVDESPSLEALAPEGAPATGVAEAPPCDAVRYAGYKPPAASPFHGTTGYRFRLEDLHRARLTDWPPERAHRDPAWHQIWVEAERLATAHDAAISAADLVAPCPVRSVCLGGCERGPSHTHLHFLLFADLWPVSPEQAVARAVFALDAATGPIAHSVDALHPSA